MIRDIHFLPLLNRYGMARLFLDRVLDLQYLILQLCAMQLDGLLNQLPRLKLNECYVVVFSVQELGGLSDSLDRSRVGVLFEELLQILLGHLVPETRHMNSMGLLLVCCIPL